MKQLWKLKRIILLLLIPLSFGLTYLVKHNTYIAEEVFAKRIYYVYSQLYSTISGILPFSLGELVVLAIPVILTYYTIRWVLRIIKTKDNKAFLVGKGILNAGVLVAILLFMYTIGCGVNYYRYSFTTYSGLTIQESSVDELYELCMSLSVRANQLRDQIDNEDVAGAFLLSMSYGELSKEMVKAYDNLAKDYPILDGNYPGAKPLLVSKLMSRMQLTGIFFPFTMEANVNIDIPDYSLPSTIAHEMAHLRGFMREDEANYIAYLACVASNHPQIQYSGVMEALIIAGNALYDKDIERYHEVSATYSNPVRIDLNANSDYWRQFENTVTSNIAEQVNNTYLIMNDQKDGVQSYGRMVDLLLAEYRKFKQ